MDAHVVHYPTPRVCPHPSRAYLRCVPLCTPCRHRTRHGPAPARSRVSELRTPYACAPADCSPSLAVSSGPRAPSRSWLGGARMCFVVTAAFPPSPSVGPSAGLGPHNFACTRALPTAASASRAALTQLPPGDPHARRTTARRDAPAGAAKLYGALSRHGARTRAATPGCGYNLSLTLFPGPGASVCLGKQRPVCPPGSSPPVVSR